MQDRFGWPRGHQRWVRAGDRGPGVAVGCWPAAGRRRRGKGNSRPLRLDEFAILIENSAATPDVATLAASINSALAEPMYTDGAGLAVSGCVGVMQHQGRGGEVATLLRAAEAALHRVKSSGQRQWGLSTRTVMPTIALVAG